MACPGPGFGQVTWTAHGHARAPSLVSRDCRGEKRGRFRTDFLLVREIVLAYIKISRSISLRTADGQPHFESRTDGLLQLLIALQPSSVNQARTRSNIGVDKLDGLHRRHHDHRPGSPEGT